MNLATRCYSLTTKSWNFKHHFINLIILACVLEVYIVCGTIYHKEKTDRILLQIYIEVNMGDMKWAYRLTPI